MKGIRPFYCKRCGRFLSRTKVRYTKLGWAPHYNCKKCGDCVFVTKYAIEAMIMDYADTFEERLKKEYSSGSL